MKAIIVTVAYNSEKTIRNTIDSILAQSYSDFVYYIVDNGSMDGTGEIIREYSQVDPRIVVITKEENDIWVFFEVLPNILKNHNKTDYFCTIDADDTYNNDFLEKMLAFMKKECLDIAACGNDFIDSGTDKVLGKRNLSNDLILSGRSFGDYFPVYHQFMRTIWAKIYSLSVLLEDKFEPRYEMGYGGDTIFAIEAFSRANRVGIFAESLHKYYMSSKSASYQFNEKRIVSDRILFNVACDFLISKVGNTSKQNEDFLFRVYYYAVVDTLKVLFNAEVSIWDKLLYLIEILQNRLTQLSINCKGAEQQKNQLLNDIVGWVLSEKVTLSATGLDINTTLLTQIESYFSKTESWKDDELFQLLLNIRKKSLKFDVIDALIVSTASKSPFLAGLDSYFLVFFNEIVSSILQNDERKALSQIKDIIAEGTDIPDEYIVAFLLLGLNLSAKLEFTDDFIYFKKLQISVLIDFLRTDEAQEELADWHDILPNDIDFKDLRARLMVNLF